MPRYLRQKPYTHPDPAGNLYSSALLQSREHYPSPTLGPPQVPFARIVPPTDLSDMPHADLAQLLHQATLV